MKQVNLLFAFLLFFTFANLNAQNTYIPDDNFEQALINLGYDSGELNDSVPTANINVITDLNINSKNISDLTGIEDFTYLLNLYCNYNNIVSLNLSENINLWGLECKNNKITDLNISSCSQLHWIDCSKNNLSNLDISNNIALNSINCSENQLINLDVKNCLELRSLNCNLNHLTNIDISANTELSSLNCCFNEIKILNLSNNSNLTLLNCFENNISDLDLSNNTALRHIECYSNQIANLNVSNSSELIELTCQNNLLQTLDVSNNLLLMNLLCSNNQLSTLNVATNPNLFYLQCSDNQVENLDISENNKLILLKCDNNKLAWLNAKNGNNLNMTSADPHTGFSAINNPDLTCIQVDNQEKSLTYEDWAKDENASYSENCSLDQTKIPLSEYNSLVELYNSTLGEEWFNNENWLDTVNSSANYWYGITVTNGHVTKIELPDNNLQEAAFENPLQLSKLEVLDLSGNNLDDANFSSLDILSNLTSLHIENNGFVFKHIIEIFDLTNYCNFSGDFTYSPQKKIDLTEELELTPGETLEMSINPFFVSSGDLFQWYKDGLPLEGETEDFYDKTNVTINDSGSYYLVVTNPDVAELTLQSKNKHVTIKELVGGVPRSEYDALVVLFNSMNGINWNNNTNWLDTTNHSVSDWYGITVSEEHITHIILNNNNLNNSIPKEIEKINNLQSLNLFDNHIEGPIPNEIGNLNKLQYLNLERNLIGKMPENSSRVARQIPDEIGNISSLNTLRLSYNYLQFNDIEAIFSWSNYPGFIDFSYNYQNGLHERKEITAEPGENITVTMSHYFPGNYDTFQWVKNNDPISGGNSETLELENVQLADEGSYYCIISNSVVPDLSIFNYSTTITINDVHGAGVRLSEYKALEKFYTVNNGENWKWNENWLDTVTCSVGEWAGVQVEDGHVRMLRMDSTNVTGALPEELADLIFLEKFYAFGNNITGPLPSWIGELTNLERLHLGNNNLSGEIPASIGQLKKLNSLELSRNKLEGNIPPEIGNDTSLVFLALDNNNLTGPIPEEIGNLKKLRHLILEHNGLSGTIPGNLGALTNLFTLDLSHNQLTGPLPVELKNLESIYRFDIDYNLLGEIDLNKSAVIDNNRQIPDELASLLQMDSLYLGGNQLQFNDIEAIFSWENYNSFKEFIYVPQDSIGVSTLQQTSPGENLILSIENYFAGPSDQYQWYKNGSSIYGATTATLALNDLQLSDAGKYYCKIINPVATELTLYSRAITVQVTEEIKGAGVPLSEYKALIEIFDNFGGNNWSENTNWLDTINYSVGEWERITVENGHVTALDLSGLNLEGNISAYFADFDSLKWLNLSNNDFNGIFTSLFEKSALKTSIISEESTLKYLNIANNKFVFADLEPSVNELKSINEFIYAPQAKIGNLTDTAVFINQNIEFTISNYTCGESDDLVWYKDGTEITGANQLTFSIENATVADSGKYTCQVTNSVFPELTLFSDTLKLSVLIPDGIEKPDIEDIRIYPNPGKQRIFVETGNKSVHIKAFDLAGVLILEKKNFQSGWIEIQSFVPGIYLFRMEDKNGEVINKKVIIK
ncbi:immunoglobulin domain-containing protein [Maribellus maritimus]|uniref:immunoglobulin domain-containing protein n=1 Tax=Maribellus maritimus TaxID=2870838 RepID=UPI001EE9EA25|nr:immunoglobulin domain-containing protein [Maribellus maritimus]MCG6190175.1 T9SS type A sorting domain-containing protein [Maribellus maritimus]